MSKKHLTIVNSKTYSRNECLNKIKTIGFEHQDNCELCKRRMEVAWMLTIQAKVYMSKLYPQGCEISGSDIQDIFLTALNNIGIDPALFRTHLKD